MRLELTGRHVTITPAVRRAVERSLARIARMLNDSVISVQVVITREKARHYVEMTLHARGDHFMHGAAEGRDVGGALGAAVEKLEHQAQKLKSRWTEGKRQGVSAAKAGSPGIRPERAGRAFAPDLVAPEPDGDVVRIIRARRYAVKPMSVDEAALEVGAALGAFLVFRNATTDSVNVLFRRPDGHLGLIEPEA
ncbi:MAG: ribosomal subunit interface protein [Acidobacteria bacterium RIFCSPLOWO2_02_FULL_68_18]|nr:MAG: ribosomal subunit interface protein [Acidobacteria bacterium RIFCSPLOWO2_02_FULL_68_18]OFW47992.1 MAG: ribosomal subunit interface protein [Acidobacteria bacterium RIFCSPLOWO2_12_FULL_68_19]